MNPAPDALNFPFLPDLSRFSRKQRSRSPGTCRIGPHQPDQDTNSLAWMKIDPKSSRQERSLALPTISANNSARSSMDILVLPFSVNLAHVEIAFYRTVSSIPLSAS